MKSVIALVCGTLFGIGLSLSGMTDTTKVIGFLDITGQWDPTLMFVMASALAISLPLFLLTLKKAKPWLAEQFYLPTSQHIDKPLLIGASLFGIGWGVYGYCPGPALAALTYGYTDTYLFVAAMTAGMFAQKFLRSGS